MSNHRRSFHVSALCLLTSLLGGGLAAGCAYDAESPLPEEVGEAAEAVLLRQAWSTVAAPNIDHQGGAAVRLGNGKVLVTNGRDFNAEIYDPATNTWAFHPFSPWETHWDYKIYLTASLLPSGNVVVSTGFSGTFNGLYELYDTTNDLWTSAWISPLPPSFSHAGVTLQDGRAVMTGGTALNSSFTRILAFDEPTMTWSTIGDMIRRRELHTSTVLDDGRVLSAGGQAYLMVSGGYEYWKPRSAEIFDPSTGASTLTGSIAVARFDHTATRLANGKVLITGGTGSPTAPTSSELYDPYAGTWSPTGALALGRAHHNATLLQDGRVLVTGGVGTKTTELYASATGTWSASSPMNITTTAHTATRLADGRVLVVGSATSGPTAEIYDPSPQCLTFQRGSLGTTADAQIGSGNPTKNYGTSVVANSGGVAGSIRQALFSFDLSAIPTGSVVTSATLRVYATAFSGEWDQVEVHSVMVPWTETAVTWNSFGNAWEADTFASFFSGTAVGWRSADITGLVRGWQSGAKPNNGVILVQNWMNDHYTSYATGEATLASTRPALEVCFSAP
jgi:hypothetical protein